MLNIVILSVVLFIVIVIVYMLNVIMLNVVAPVEHVSDDYIVELIIISTIYFNA
jgi:hypothetical protein